MWFISLIHFHPFIPIFGTYTLKNKVKSYVNLAPPWITCTDNKRYPRFITSRARSHGQEWPSSLISEAILSLIKNTDFKLASCWQFAYFTLPAEYTAVPYHPVHQIETVHLLGRARLSLSSWASDQLPTENSRQGRSVSNPMSTWIHLYLGASLVRSDCCL